MKRFNLCAISTKLEIAIDEVKYLLSHNTPMMTDISGKQDWKYNSGSGLSIHDSLLKERDVINVYIVPSKNTKAVAYFQNGNIYIYQSYLDYCSIGELIGTLLHEYAHYCGFNHNSSFGTSNFKTKAKCLYSVPYYLSENVTRWI
jgi:hypothetical protein